MSRSVPTTAHEPTARLNVGGVRLNSTMTETDPIVEYWESVRAKAKIGRVASVIGPGALASVPPVAMALGDTPELADELLGMLVAGRKRAIATAVAELGGAEPPEPGNLTIVLDGAGYPRAFIRTTAVTQVAFRDVTPDFAEAAGAESLEDWRAEHQEYWARVLGEGAFDEDMPVLCETFEVLDPTPGGWRG